MDTRYKRLLQAHAEFHRASASALIVAKERCQKRVEDNPAGRVFWDKFQTCVRVKEAILDGVQSLDAVFFDEANRVVFRMCDSMSEKGVTVLDPTLAPSFKALYGDQGRGFFADFCFPSEPCIS